MGRHLRLCLAVALMGSLPMMAKAEDPGGPAALKLKPTSDDVAELGRINPVKHMELQKERDGYADDLVRLGDYLHAGGFVLDVEGFPSGVVDIAIHHLGLKSGYMDGIEASAKLLLEAQEQVGNIKLALDAAGQTIQTYEEETRELKLALDTAQARAKREADAEAEAAELVHADTDLSPVERLQHPLEEFEAEINTHFRTGGDAVIELHNATGRLKQAVRQIALIEQSENAAAA